jgi:hypothetical protein
MASNYIYTSPTETVIDSGAGSLNICSNDIVVEGEHMKYAVHPTVWTGATQLVDVAYVTGRTAGAITYQCDSPSTIKVGGMFPGTVLTGRGLDDILQEILVPYIAPSFSSFNAPTIPTMVEVGYSIPINTLKTFNWGFTGGANVSDPTMCIVDMNAGVNRALNVSASALTMSVDITPTTSIAFTSCGQLQRWCGSAKNTNSVQFNSTAYSMVSLYPYYWGIVNAPGASGAGRPSSAQIVSLINTGSGVGTCHKVLSNSDDISGGNAITFNSTGSDYKWFAIPSTVNVKLRWCVTSSDCGAIGGAVNPGGNLFPDPVLDQVVTSASPVWSTNYDIYISNKQGENLFPMGFKYS